MPTPHGEILTGRLHFPVDRIRTTILWLSVKNAIAELWRESLLGGCSLSELNDVVGLDLDMFWLDRNFKSKHLQPVP